MMTRVASSQQVVSGPSVCGSLPEKSSSASEPRTRLGNEDLDQAQRLIAQLQAALSPLESLASSKPNDFAGLAERHRNVLIELTWTWIGAPPPRGPDTHPNAVGYLAIAGAFYKAIGPF